VAWFASTFRRRNQVFAPYTSAQQSTS